MIARNISAWYDIGLYTRVVIKYLCCGCLYPW